MRDVGPGELAIAPVLLRALALMIDAAIVICVTLAVAAALGDVRVESRGTYGVLLVVIATYHIGFLIAKSATPGKIAMNLYVGDVEGQALTPDRAILRYVAYFVGGAVVIGSIASIYFVLFDPQRRAVHDRVAGTRVFVGKPTPSPVGGGFGGQR